MPIRYKINVLAELKDKGISTYKIGHEKIFGQSTIQKLRTKKLVDWSVIEKLCIMLDCQPGDIVEFIPDETNEQ